MKCTRCQGLMIREQFVDFWDDTGCHDFAGWRCLNCGEVVDPLVLMHRINGSNGPYRSRTRNRWTRGDRTTPVAV